MDAFIKDQLSQVDFSFSKFDELIRSIRLGSGIVTLDQLADEANMSPRTLQRKMTNTLGVGAKSFSKVVRFKQVLSFISEHPEYDWQDVLYRCGYYDQAHFIKDFKKYTGRTPGAFIQNNEDLSSLFLED